MKIINLTFFLFLTIGLFAQAPNNKNKRDSLKYYQNELRTFWKNGFDSLKNSEKQKLLRQKISGNKKDKTITLELLANLGIYIADFKNLNMALKSIGQDEVKNIIPSFGSSFAIGYPNVIYGFEANAYTLSAKNTRYKGGHFRFFIGTHLFRKSKFVLNPQIGLTTSTLNLYINKSPVASNFNNLFTTNGNFVQLQNSNNFLDFAMGLKLHFHRKEPDYFQFCKFGYRIPLKQTVWGISNGGVSNVPIDNNRQFYFQFSIGFDR